MEKEIIKTALDNVKKNVPIEVKFKREKLLDGELYLRYHQEELCFAVETKGEVRQYIIPQLEKLREQHTNVLLLAERIPRGVKETLREKRIPYIEANGNLYLEANNIYLYVDNNRAVEINKERGNRAFTKTGLKVLFHFLVQPELVNHTQREIANFTGVGLGNIPQVIDGLRNTGYLIPLNKREYIWENREELINRWINDYQTILKPSLKTNKYEITIPWKQINLNEKISVWGGEAGADILTNFLRPEKFILYTNEKQANLIRNYKLKPKIEGELEVIEMFWNQDLNEVTAPPLLIYAELVIEGGKRNNETAKLIFDDYIKSKL